MDHKLIMKSKNEKLRKSSLELDMWTPGKPDLERRKSGIDVNG